MKLRTKSLLVILILAGLTAVAVQTQEQPKPNVKHFVKDGLSFDYPTDWDLSDQSTSQMQLVVLSRNGYSEIRLRTPREWLKSPQKEAEAKRIIHDQYVDQFVKTIEGAGMRPSRTDVNTQMAGGEAPGTRVRAILDREPGGMDAYYRVISDRFVQLSALGSEREITRSAPAWDTIRNSLQLEGPAVPRSAATPSPTPGRRRP